MQTKTVVLAGKGWSVPESTERVLPVLFMTFVTFHSVLCHKEP